MPSLDEILNRRSGTFPAAVPVRGTGVEMPKKFLIVLGFWDGDRDMMATLCHLIADLEERPNPDADIMLYRRNDAQPMAVDVVQKLQSKFAKVHQHACRRRNATGYPCGSNEMFYDLTELMRTVDWSKKYFAFLNMEADCVPLHPQWIGKLIDEYRRLTAHDSAFAVGHIYHYTPNLPDHLNGAAIYATDIFNRIPGSALLGGPGSIAYDFHHAKSILPVARDTALMDMDFNRKTITAAELFSRQKYGEFPVYLHGVKDLSAITAVRAKFIPQSMPMGSKSDLSHKTICTYADPANAEEQAQLEAWREAWLNAGWNPVVLGRYDAQRNPACPKDGRGPLARSPRHPLLALEYNGGGLYADVSVLPRHTFSPASPQIPELTITPWGDCALADLFCRADKSGVSKQSDRITDAGTEGYQLSPLVRFSDEACAKMNPGVPKSRLMLHFLRARA